MYCIHRYRYTVVYNCSPKNQSNEQNTQIPVYQIPLRLRLLFSALGQLTLKLRLQSLSKSQDPTSPGDVQMPPLAERSACRKSNKMLKFKKMFFQNVILESNANHDCNLKISKVLL